MKLFKKLAAICMALTMCFGLGMAFTACGGNDNPGAEQNYAATYVFNVTKNNAAAVGYQIQLCSKNADGTLGACEQPVDVGSDGIAKVGITDVSTAYEIHVMKDNKQLGKDYYAISGLVDIPANYNGGTITIIITK